MIKFIKGDIFASGCEAICNPVNCFGTMGIGLAKAFKLKYPEMNKSYIEQCNIKALRPGIMHIWENHKGNPKYIVNFPTKDHWQKESKIEYIIDGLSDLKLQIKLLNIKSIGIPGLGCGYGNLDYKDVKPLLEKFAEDLPEVDIIAYEPL